MLTKSTLTSPGNGIFCNYPYQVPERAVLGLMVHACRKALQAPVCQFSLIVEVYMCLINAIFGIDFLFSVYLLFTWVC